jgi:hypothetical protein
MRTVVDAVEDFTETRRARGVTCERVLQFEHLLELRCFQEELAVGKAAELDQLRSEWAESFVTLRLA